MGAGPVATVFFLCRGVFLTPIKPELVPVLRLLRDEVLYIGAWVPAGLLLLRNLDKKLPLLLVLAVVWEFEPNMAAYDETF